MEIEIATALAPRVPTTQIPLGVLYNQNLSFGARLMYGVLFRYQYRDRTSTPDQTALARDLGCTSRAVRNYLAELKTADLVTIEPHIGNQPTRYHQRFVA